MALEILVNIASGRLVAWWHKAINWTNVSLPSMRFSDTHSRQMFTWTLKISIPKLCLKFACAKSQPHLPGDKWVKRELCCHCLKALWQPHTALVEQASDNTYITWSGWESVHSAAVSPAFINLDKFDPWTKDQLKITCLQFCPTVKIFLTCGRD